jgi:cyanophycinase
MNLQVVLIVTTLASMLFAGHTTAEDNILSLPVSKNTKRPPSVVLHGGGRITEDVFERFVELAGGPQARIVFIPSAGYIESDYDSREEFVEELHQRYSAWPYLEISGQVKSFRFLFTDEPEDADSEDFVGPLEQATGVWFSGGRQGRLNYRYVGEYPERTRFQSALVNVLERGGVVGGTSAGMAALPEIMTLWQDEDEDGRPPFAVTGHGLGIMRGAIVEQHFDTVGGRLERFTGLLRDVQRLNRLAGRESVGEQIVGLAVEESTALVVTGDTLHTMGIGNTHVFLRSPSLRALTWYELPSGGRAVLTRQVGETSLERIHP